MSNPVVTIVTSLPPATAFTPIVFTIVGGASAPLRRMWASVAFPGIIDDEVVHNGDRFGVFYTNGTNTRVSIANGYQVTILRDGGWPVGSFPLAASFTINAVDTLGGGDPPGLLAEVWADSNGMGAGTNTFDADPSFGTDVPNNNVVLTKLYTNNFSEPVGPTHVFSMGTGPLRAENVNATPGYGPELEIGRVLNDVRNGVGSAPDAQHKVWIDAFAIHSSMLADWQHGSTAGTASPLLGGGNLDDDSNARALTAAAASGRVPVGVLVMLCSNDASNGTATANIPANVPAFIARKRAIHGSQLLFVWVVIQSTLPAGTFPNVATARANQIAALTGASGVAIVYAEDIPTIDDLAHYVAVGMTTLSTRAAFALVRLAGLNERAVTAPTVVGFSSATFNGSTHGKTGFSGVPGSTLRAWPWQGSNDGDVMFVAAFRGDVGAGSPIPVPGAGGGLPASWTQAIQVSDTDGAGVGNHASLSWKNLAQSEKDANVDTTGGPGFPVTVALTPGGVQFALKSFTVRGPGRFPVVGTPASFTHTTLDTSGVTAPGVATTVGQTVFLMVFGWSNVGQSFAAVNGSLSGLTQVFGAAYPSSSGNYLFIGLWQGTATTTTSGNSTVTPTLAAGSLGFTWAM